MALPPDPAKRILTDADITRDGELKNALAPATSAQAAAEAAQTASQQAAADAQTALAAQFMAQDEGVAALLSTSAGPLAQAALLTQVASGMSVTTNAQGNGPNVILGAKVTNGVTPTGAAIAPDISNGVILNPGGTGYNNIIGGDASAVDTITPNVTAAGTGAHVSVVGGYDNVAGALSSKIISDHSYVSPDAVGGHNAIYGGAKNKIRGAAAKFSSIGGGQENDIQSAYSFAVGVLNTVTGNQSRASGDHNTVSGKGATADGSTNIASGDYSTVTGSSSEAAGSYSMATGRSAWARRYGQRARATGSVATKGDVQASDHVVYAVTTDATPTTLGVVGGTTYNSNHWMLNNTTAMVEALVVGRSAGGTVHAGFSLRALVRHQASGNAVVIGVPSVEDFNPAAECAATIVAALSVGQVAVKVTGLAATTIQWCAEIRIVESVRA